MASLRAALRSPNCFKRYLTVDHFDRSGPRPLAMSALSFQSFRFDG
jgi:hypothetical protein